MLRLFKNFRTIQPRFLSSSVSSNILLDRPIPESNGIVTMSLNRDVGKNAFSKDMLHQFVEIVNALNSDQSVKVLILKSTVAKVFCAGADLKERQKMADSEVGDFVATLRHSFHQFSKLPFPTIAAIEGVALGGGLELALCCDLRIAGFDAKLGLPETALAIIPGAGGTQRLPRLVGTSKAKELIFSAKVLNAKEAEGIGLVNIACEAGTAEKKALELALSIAKNGPVGIRSAKAAIDEGIEVSLEEGLTIEKRCYGNTIYTADRKEGIAAFVEKRSPVYLGR